MPATELRTEACTPPPRHPARPVLALIVFAAALSACEPRRYVRRDPIVIFAASSVADVLREIADRFTADTRVPVLINRAASGTLCAQIQLGAECDVFIPAAPTYLDRLARLGAIADGSRRPLARNRLVLVSREPEEAPWPNLERLRTPSAAASIAIADPAHAPAGQYARQALRRAGAWEAVEPHLVLADNVRLAARYVARGAVRLAVVYATDARAFDGELSIVYRFPRDAHDDIVYEGAACRNGHPEGPARAFLQFAASEAAAGIWRNRGFRTLEPQPRTAPRR